MDLFTELFTKTIETKYSKYKQNKYATNVSFPHSVFATELFKLLRNSIYFSRYEATHNGKLMKGKYLNAKHLEYVRMGVYDELYKQVLSMYYSDDYANKMKYQKTDTVFIPNKLGTEMLGRNVEYKSKQGLKISFIVDSTNVPFAMSFGRGSDADSTIFYDTYENMLNDPSTEKYKGSNKYKQYMLADAGYESEEIKNKLNNDGYILFVGKNLRRSKPESYDIKPLSEKDHKKFNKRTGIENLNSWVKQYGILNNMYEHTIDSYKGLLLLALSYIVFVKHKKNMLLKKMKKHEREKQRIAKEKEIERKNNMRKIKYKMDKKKRAEEKESRKQRKQNGVPKK